MLRFAAVVMVMFGFATGAMAQPMVSRITAVEVKSITRDGTYGGVTYSKVSGVLRGQVDPREPVIGLAALPRNANGWVDYASNFEIIAPSEGQPINEAVYLDVENRGSAISQSALGGFLQRHGVTYARVQWQTGISEGVPQNAQGIGLVILRDFGRWLRFGGERSTGGYVPNQHWRVMIGGISQSAWAVNTLIAEGFNVNPISGDGVFDAAVAVDGVGYWLAINQLGRSAGVSQTPYIVPNGLPLQRAALLKRPDSDPLYVDIANYSDFYRLRAGLTSTDYTSPKFRRYDFPSPHAVGTAQSGARCNGGQPVTFHTLRYAPYLRAIVLATLKEIGAESAKDAKSLPPSKVFTLAASPPALPNFNGLPGVAVRVPVVENGWPSGGVEFPESAVRIGDIDPPAVAPAVTTSIAETCGNFSGFKPYSRAFLDALYGGRRGWLESYGEQVDRLIREGFLLAEDKAGMIEAARRTWPAE